MTDWLPAPLGWAMAAVFVLVTAAHVRHALAVWPQARSVAAWHTGHVLMAVGMVVMSAPTVTVPPAGAAVGVFCTAAVVAVAWAGVVLLRPAACSGVARPRAWAACWAVLAVDLAIMAWMWTVSTASSTALVLAAVTWLVMEVGLWVSKVLPGRGRRGGGRGVSRARATPGRPGTDLTTASTRGGWEPAGATGGVQRAAAATATLAAPTAAAAPEDLAARGAAGRTAHDAHAWLATTMVVMALGMAYMLLAMHFGSMTMSPGGPGGGSMGSMSSMSGS